MTPGALDARPTRSPRAQVLSKSGYLLGSPKLVEKRLLETGIHTFACCASAGALRPWHAGWAACLRVRALHAKVRRRLLRPANEWDVAAWGVPVNQEDTAVTLLAFSYVVLTGIEMILGKPLPEADQLAYLHLWRYIGFLMGLDEAHNPCARGLPHARASLESVIMHILEPTAESGAIARHLLRAPLEAARLSSVGYRLFGARREAALERAYVRSAQYTRFFVGDVLGDALGLPADAGGAQRRLALAVLMALRLYGWLACVPPIGAALGALSKGAMLLALVVLRGRRHVFPLSYEAGEDDGRRMCPVVAAK